jgi:hypothetical protein
LYIQLTGESYENSILRSGNNNDYIGLLSRYYQASKTMKESTAEIPELKT